MASRSPPAISPLGDFMFLVANSSIADRRRGLAFVAVLVLVLLVTTMGLAFLMKVGAETTATMSRGENMQAHYLAEAAANHAMWRLLNEPAFPADETIYYMHSLANGRYGYKVRRHTDTTFATVATVGATERNVVQQSYVIHILSSLPGEPINFGYQTVFPGSQSTVRRIQIATQVSLSADANITSITAHVGGDDKDVRYAIYADVSGEPGALIAETGLAESEKDTMAWLTIPLPSTTLSAGTYWLALAFDDSDQKYQYEGGQGETRYNSNDAVDDGYSSTWGSSTMSLTRRISIYASGMTTGS